GLRARPVRKASERSRPTAARNGELLPLPDAGSAAARHQGRLYVAGGGGGDGGGVFGSGGRGLPICSNGRGFPPPPFPPQVTKTLKNVDPAQAGAADLRRRAARGGLGGQGAE